MPYFATISICKFLQEQLVAPHQDPATLIRSAGKRVTNARLTVAHVLQHDKEHMTATQVLAAVAEADAHIDQSTVYRVLADLRDSGLVAESRFGSCEASYEWLAGSNHHHLHCTECGGTTPLDHALVDQFTKAVGTQHGFAADATHMVLNGICERCCGK
jgi:Fur family ferric uptake transcriptional regulator